MRNYPLISIALCTYNGEPYLKKQIQSLLSQSYPNLEFIISDDASSDQTLSILNSYSYPNFQVHQNTNNLGYNKNFESCLRRCTGDYICISDQDDEWEKDKILNLYERIQNNPMIFSDSVLINENGEPLNQTMSSFLRKPFQPITSPLQLVYANIVSGHSMLFQRKLLDLALPIPEGIFYDWWLAFIASTKGTISFLNNPLVKHREHDQSAMLQHSQFQDKAQRKIIKHKELLKRLELFIEVQSLSRQDKIILENLLPLLKERESKQFSWKLFTLLAKHGDNLFIKYHNRSFLNRLNNYIKETKKISY